MSFNVENYFVLFGLLPKFQQDLSQVKIRYLELQKRLHPDNFAGATPQEKMLAVQYAAGINQAYQTLCDPLKRAIYLLKLEGIDVLSETDNSMPTAFLVEQMSLRESLDEASSEEECRAVKAQIQEAFSQCQKELAQALEMKQWPEAKMSIKKMQFYTRLQNDILEAV